MIEHFWRHDTVYCKAMNNIPCLQRQVETMEAVCLCLLTLLFWCCSSSLVYLYAACVCTIHVLLHDFVDLLLRTGECSLLQNPNLSVEGGKMRESLSSVNWCNTDFKKRPLSFLHTLLAILLRAARPCMECCHVLLTWNWER